jgi:elongator complex protein 1
LRLVFQVTVRDLKWSPCAQILTIHTETPATDSQNIHLLTASNYKWYSKQTLTFRADNPLLYFDWVETTQFTFVLRAVTKKQIVNYTFRTSVCNSSAICAVIDGQTLQLTDFSEAVIPPIMCSKKIINDSPINFVMLKNSDAAIIDSKNHLKIIDIDKAEFIATVNLEEVINDACQFPLTFHHFIFKKQIIYLAAENESGVVFYSINPQKSAAILINSTIDRLRHLIPLSRNEVVEGLKQVEVMVYMNDSSCPNSLRQTVKIVNDKIYNCQLTTNCHFYVNNQKLSDCVNSYTIFGEYLLYTTKENELHCLRLEEEYLEDSSIQNYRRNIEQGATIVAAIPDSPRIVLQLPRGNLETISCRLISIDILDCLLSNRNWEEAMRFIRLEKLNANLLFDLDSKRFLGQIERFIRGAKTVNELSRMCLEFEEVNVLNTLYKNWGKSEEHPDKISAIFEGMFKYFDKIDYAPYITTIMAINLNFFALRYALMYLQDLLRRSFDDPALKKNLIEAINTLKTYGCTQDDLYSESLLLYDLDLARFVASCCQLDPRVYEPQLNSLKNLSEVERRFKINVFCKKPQAAVAYLLRCADSSADEISSFIKSHNVSREAYESCPKNHRHHRTVSLAFGQDLSRRGCHREAGTIFRRAKLLEEALEEFKKCMHWREIINLMNELKVEEKVKLRMIGCMARALAGDRSTVKDAAILYEHYANDFEMAVNVLARNYFLEEAIHVATRHNQREIIAFEVLPMLHRQKTHFGEKLIELFDTYDQYRTRLAQVRQIKVDKFNRTYDDDDRDDLFSDAGSTITKSSRSSRSRSSTASSRNRRKEEKKKQDLRQGGVYEDIALVRALHSTIKEFYGKGEEVRTWCLLALQETDISYQDVKKIHDYYWSVDGKIEEGLKEIWPPHFNAHRQTQDPKELADLENFEHLDVEYRTPPSGRNTWNLNLF